MTNTNDALKTLADLILNSDDEPLDLIEMIDALEPLIAPSLLSTLCEMLELCPMHHCDYRICLDDERDECAHLH